MPQHIWMSVELGYSWAQKLFWSKTWAGLTKRRLQIRIMGETDCLEKEVLRRLSSNAPKYFYFMWMDINQLFSPQWGEKRDFPPYLFRNKIVGILSIKRQLWEKRDGLGTAYPEWKTRRFDIWHNSQHSFPAADRWVTELHARTPALLQCQPSPTNLGTTDSTKVMFTHHLACFLHAGKPEPFLYKV